MPHRTDIPHHRLSASLLPPEVEPEERDFMRLLEKALAPSYTLVERVGSGGMGAVYLARDPVLKRLVAVKVMSPALAADETARARFEREAQSVASISHPNVVSVYSVGELANGVPFLVMQYIEGQSMAERLQKEGPLDARTAKRMLGEVASALAAAHRKGIIHRDIKPANILWDDDTGRAMVTDFGIAAVLERGDAEREAVQITHTGMAIGTPAYMSPEQLLAEPVTEKTDIYSLGLLGYELFIAEGPYQISSPREVMAAHLRDTPRKLSSMRADIDPELERVLEACLTKDPTKRPSAAEVETRLTHGASVLLEWPPPGMELLSARLRLAVRIVMTGAFAFAIPAVALSVFDRGSFVRQALPPELVLLPIAGFGFLAFVAGLEALRRFVREAQKLVASGYGWGTVIEVASDERGDTGVLVAGGREYAELLPPARSVMRRNRIVATALRVVASLTPVLGYGLGVLFGARSDAGPFLVLASSILLSVALLLTSTIITAREERAMRPARTRIRTAVKRVEGVAQLAQAWRQTFEQVRMGQWLGMGSANPGRAARIVMIMLLTVAITEGVVVMLALALTTGLSSAAAIAVPKFGPTRAKVERISRLSAYRTRPDSTITPLRAGQALHAITRNGPGGAVRPFEKTPVISIPPQPSSSTPRDPFDAADGGFQVMAFRQAPRGFSTAQRDFLRALADNTALEEFRILGRAKSLDFPAAYWDIRSGSVPSWGEIPIPKFAPVTAAANANIAAAALAFAAGQRDEAEQRLRENINAGFLMIEDGRFLLENLVGTTMVAKARSSLSALYDMSGRSAEAKAMSPERDPVITIVESTRDTRPTLEEINVEVHRMLLDDNEVTGLRWEMLIAWFAFEPCADMHQVLFGADARHLAVLEEARTKLIKRQSDSLLFLIVEGRSDQRARKISSTGKFDWGHHRPVARMVSALTGNRQLEACLDMVR